MVTEPNAVKTPDVSPFPEPSPQTVTPEQPVAEAEPAPLPRVARGRGEPQRPAAAPRPPRSASAAQRPAAPPLVPPAPDSLRTESLTPPPPGSEQIPGDDASERDDAEYAPASRLGGLRNLLVTLGRRSLRDGEIAGESDSDLEPRFEKATVRPAYSDTPLPADGARENGVPVRLTAHPEFLPPKPVAAEVEKEKEVVRPTPPRRENWDRDEIQTLPSWRGQYRKKRYPPI